MARCVRCGSSEWSTDRFGVCASCNGTNVRAAKSIIGAFARLFTLTNILLFVGIASCSQGFNHGPWWALPLAALCFWLVAKSRKN